MRQRFASAHRIARPGRFRPGVGSVVGLAALVLTVLLAGRAGGHDRALQASHPPPNIVLLVTDDQDLLLGSLDRMPQTKALLAGKGLSFTNYFVTQALCCPSRASILTGQHVHNHGVITTSPPLGGFVKFHAAGHENETIAVALQAAGYDTALIGKYFNGYPRTEAATYVPPGWSEWQVPSPTPAAYSQFDYTLNVNGSLVSHGAAASDYLTDVLAKAANDFVKQRTAAGRPFFLYLAPTAPHEPIVPAPRHAHAFPGLLAPRGGSFDEANVRDKPVFLRGPRLSPAVVARLDRKYRARAQSMLAIDEMVAALFATLSQAGVLGNTYVFFTSDNGFHLGQHRLIEGKNTAYEEDIHVPLLVRGPGIAAGGKASALAANIDLAPTFAELAGVSLPSPADGRSLVPLLRGTAPQAWRRVLLLERPDLPVLDPATAAKWGSEALERDSGEGANPGFRGLRLPGEVFVEHSGGACEDYDLRHDPYELDNRCAGLAAARRTQLSAWLAALATCRASSCRSLEASPAP